MKKLILILSFLLPIHLMAQIGGNTGGNTGGSNNSGQPNNTNNQPNTNQGNPVYQNPYNTNPYSNNPYLIAHEFGHSFDLRHTFEGSSGSICPSNIK